MANQTTQEKKRDLDKTDCNIIKLLQKDGRISNTMIAKKLGISEATARTRLNRLTREGFIQIVAVSNPLKIGYPLSGVIRINVDIKKIDSVTEALDKIKEIWFIVHATGSSDIYTEFIASSLEALDELIYQKINMIDGVIRTDASLILKYIKRRYDWGTGNLPLS
jgi:Lrp/AsnC family transcriptional regulator for asnA, asnC and gidA